MSVVDQLHLPESPIHYEKYEKQCQIPIRCEANRQCPKVGDWFESELLAKKQATLLFSVNNMMSSEESYLIGSEEYDFQMFATNALNTDDEIGVKNTMTTESLLSNLVNDQNLCAIKNMLEERCNNVNQSLSLNECQHTRQYKCNPSHPFRSYSGICNNLGHATWGLVGNPFKMEMAPCFEDFVSKPRLSSHGRTLPNSRQLMLELQRAQKRLPERKTFPGNLNIFELLLSELVNTDMIGRAIGRVSKATGGFRGCQASGDGLSPYKSPLADPQQVFANDSNYEPLRINCLNFSPIENANDNCKITYLMKRNTETSYLDLSNIYEEGKYDENGKLEMTYCQASQRMPNNVVSVQLLAVAGLFTQLHNDCVDRVRSCNQIRPLEEIAEVCRSLTIGVYQKIVYEELIKAWMGEKFYEKCNFNTGYNPSLESVISSIYVNGPGRFQHVWIPESITYLQRKVPFHMFFNNYQHFNCAAVLEGMFDDPINLNGLTHSVMHTFFSKDGIRGHCLPCLDLYRSRNAGICSLLSYSHYFSRLSGAMSKKCYHTFDDLSDMFDSELIDVFKSNFESPFDIDVLFSIFEKEFPEDSFLPNTVALATCREFKRLKASDRFFYTWNKFLSPAAKELMNIIDLKTLLALFGGIDKVPVKPLVTESERISAQLLRDVVNRNQYLFCAL
ncbi:peroxidase skpo-1-like [Malaya genurostris]|uniref:peroxidase skpo-1-like n=1 Tax=Malaya genurostris TaxID=325434 RepID=UPI0026F38DAE|nr:peroxidase skpo-1-like [Malaya genurostris]